MDVTAADDADAEEVLDGVHLAQLAAGERTSLQQFRIDPGATVGEHSHRHEQTGYVVSGVLTFVVDGDELAVGPGDSFTIPADEPHAAENRGDDPAVGVEAFSPPRPTPPWAE